MIVAILLALGDTVILKDKASVAGRFVPLLEVVEGEKVGAATREAIKDVYLGRAPEAGGERTITAEEIRRELRRRGIVEIAVQGEKVVVVASEGGLRGAEACRRAVAFEIKCRLVATRRDLPANEFSVRVTYLEPESFPEGASIVEVRPHDETDLSRAEYSVTVEDGAKRRTTAQAIARVLRIREVAFASRDLQAGRTIAREDLEIRRIEVEQTDRWIEDMAALVGSKALVKISKGAALATLDVKLKPVVRRRDVVRARHRFVEADARALEEGAVGEMIPLEFVATGSRFTGRILSSREVEVVEGGSK